MIAELEEQHRQRGNSRESDGRRKSKKTKEKEMNAFKYKLSD